MKKFKYVTVLSVSYPMINANVRGENQGNVLALQFISVGPKIHTAINGVGIARPIRDNMDSLGARMFRISDIGDSPSGYVYGPEKSITMSGARKYTEGDKRKDWADMVHRGILFAQAEKNKAEGAAEEKVLKFRASIQLSPAISATPYRDDKPVFVQGTKDTGDMAPFAFQRHYARYLYLTTINLEDSMPTPIWNKFWLDAMQSFAVGGGHTSNHSEFVVEALAWRFHDLSGAGGLFLPPDLTTGWATDKPVDFKPLFDKAGNLGIADEIRYGGSVLAPDAYKKANCGAVPVAIERLWDECLGSYSIERATFDKDWKAYHEEQAAKKSGR